QLTKRVRLIGNYVRLAADGDGNERQLASGSFASFDINRFFNGLDESVASRSRNNTWRGGLRGELALAPGVDLFAGYQTEHRDLQGGALVSPIFQQSVTFGRAAPR